MSLERAQIRYIRETLGVSSVNLPPVEAGDSQLETVSDANGMAVASPGLSFDRESKASVFVLVEASLSPAQGQLISNILKAIGETKLELVTSAEFTREGIESLSSELQGKRFIAFSDVASSLLTGFKEGQLESLPGGNALILLSALEPMLSQDKAAVGRQKKIVWDQLIPFRS